MYCIYKHLVALKKAAAGNQTMSHIFLVSFGLAGFYNI